jgi:hypothetical protein
MSPARSKGSTPGPSRRNGATATRRPAPPARSPAPPEAVSAPVLVESAESVLDLQRSAGNKAVTALLEPHAVAPLLRGAEVAQRAPGWSGADTAPGKAPDDGSTVDPKRLDVGWNTAPALVGDIWRVPVDGLPGGTDQISVGTEKDKTSEPANKRAILLYHKDIDLAYPVSVLLHLHGFTHRARDPYAGWRQGVTDKKSPGPKAGTVRDVHHDRIVAQVDRVARELKDHQLVAILPQGVGGSQFGGIERDPNGYVKEVFGKAGRDAGTDLPLQHEPPQWNLVLSAHSGGGDRLATTMSLERSGKLGGDWPVTEVILFDAIHVTENWDGVAAVVAWVEHHVARTAKALAGTTDPADRADAVARCPILRAYGSKDYKSNYERLARLVNEKLDEYGPKLGDQKAAVTARFAVEILAGAGHEGVVRGLDNDPAGGPLADALRAHADPTKASRVTGATRMSPAPAPAKTSGSVQRQPAPRTRRQQVSVSDAALRQALTAGTQEARDAVATALRNSGHPDPATWYADVVEATFLGMPISASTGTVPGVHRRLLTRLERAERALLARPEHRGMDANAVRQRLNMYSISGLRLPLPASGSEGTPSLHCFGLAVDINYAGSPFVGLQQPRLQGRQYTAARTPRLVERAMWLIHGEAFNVERGARANVTDAWTEHDRASKALVEYLALSQDLQGEKLSRLVAGAGRPSGVEWNQPTTGQWWTDLAWWQQRLTTDWALRNTYDFSATEHHGYAERTGYMDLHQHLVEDLVNAGLLWGGQYRGAKDIMHFDLQGQINR